MANMTLGTVTITRAPNRINRVISKKVLKSSLKTYGGVVAFSWGAVLVGEPFILEWEYMGCTLFDALQALYVLDKEELFDPQDGTARTFQVEIMDFEGQYYQVRASAAGAWRRNVRLELLITGEN